MFAEPTNFSDQIKITDIDGIPGTYNVLATGVWQDTTNSKYVFFVMQIKDQGDSYEIKYAFSMQGSYAISSMPDPKLHYTGTKYLLHFKDPADAKKVFMFQQDETATSITSATMLLVDLPSTYTDEDYQIGFVDGTAGIISRKENNWWVSALNTADGSTRWVKTQSGITFCSAIRGFDNYFVIISLDKSDNYHEITYIDASTGTVNFSFKFESSYTSSSS